MEDIEDYKESLVHLVEWYRDEYHRKDTCHNELIEDIKKATSYGGLEICEKIIDDWLDY